MPELWRSWESAPKIARARRKAPWVVLVIGFGGLLACILGAAVRTVGALDHVRQDQNRSLKAYLDRQSALDQIRSQIYLSGTYVRDLLLAPDPSGVAAQSSRLAGLERESKAALVTYSRSLEPEEKEPFRTLQTEIDDYWQVLSRTAQWTPEERNLKRDSFFYDELAPRRTAMLQIADRIALVNERGLTRAEDRLTASSDGLRRTLMFTFGITLAIGVALAGLTTLYTLRLERRLERGLDENARARADLQELSARLERAQENERRTLARELHDEVGQSLSAIVMETENAECATDVNEMRAHLAAVKKLAGKTVNEVRDLALLLRPSMLDDFGLAPALNWHAREMSKRTGLNVVVSADDDIDDLPDEHKTCIYRAVQEAVNNSARHANARTVEVAVKRESGRVRFQVRDDGVGFDTRFVRGLGLLGMEERVRRLGGDLRLESQLGRGTLISAELPLVDLKPADVKQAESGQAESGQAERKQAAIEQAAIEGRAGDVRIRILLADDHTVVRDGLRALLEKQPDMTVVGEAADGRETVQLADEQLPDVVVMDIAMPNMNGIEATRRIVASHPAMGVVILSMHQDESYVLRSLKAGARGYLLKDSLRGDVTDAIRTVAQGRSLLTRQVSRLLQEDYIREMERRGLEDSYDLLTDREREVLQLVAEGRANKEVATVLNISLTTVETHRAHTLQKLGLHSVPELILYAVRKGIIA